MVTLSSALPLKLLTDYGLTEREALIYLNLVRLGPVKAGLLTRSVGLNRIEVYRTLNRMVESGLAEAKAGKPTKFSAVPISQVLDRIIEEQRKRLNAMEAGRQTLQQELEKQAQDSPSAIEYRFRIVQGRRQVYTLMAAMLKSSCREVSITTTSNDLSRMSLVGLDDALHSCEDRGVEVKVVTEVDRRGLEAVQRLLEFAKVRHNPTLSAGRLLVIDDMQSLTSIAFDDTQSLNTDQDVGLFTDAKQYVALVKRLFEEAYSNSSEAAPLVSKMALEVKRLKAVAKCVGVLAEKLQDAQWDVQAPGVLVGASGAKYNFDFVAKAATGILTVALQVVVAEEGEVTVAEVMPFFLKALDCKPVKTLLVAVPELEEDAERLAHFYRVSAIEGLGVLDIMKTIDHLLHGSGTPPHRV